MYSAKASDEPVALYAPRWTAAGPRISPCWRTCASRCAHPEQFTLYFQPKIDLRTREVIGAEALVRWNHPTLGVLAPDRFIPLAETSGLIQQFTPLVLSRALTECRRWAAHGAAISVAVNLSPRNVGDATLPRQIEAALSDAGMPAGRLIVEITESSILVDPDHALRVLGEIADLGVASRSTTSARGTRACPTCTGFPRVRSRSTNPSCRPRRRRASHALVTAIVDLGRSLDLRVVAEGAETAEVLDLSGPARLRGGPGVHDCAAVPADEFLEWLVENRSRQSASLQLARPGDRASPGAATPAGFRRVGRVRSDDALACRWGLIGAYRLHWARVSLPRRRARMTLSPADRLPRTRPTALIAVPTGAGGSCSWLGVARHGPPGSGRGSGHRD